MATQTHTVIAPSPAGCYTSDYHGSCGYSIQVDPNDIVQESSNFNNSDQSQCYSPAT